MRQPSAVQPDKTALIVGVGGSDAINLTITDMGTVNDAFSLSVTGLDKLDPTWYHFEPTALPLVAGATGTARLVIAIPAGQCQAAGTYPMVISATGAVSGLLGSANATLTIVPTPPALQNVLPGDNASVGNPLPVFSWRSNTPGASKLYLRKHGDTAYTAYDVTPNAQDPTQYSYTVTTPLDPGAYEWYGTTTTSCGLTSTGTSDQPHPFSVVQSVSFTVRSYSFTVGDDDDQTTDVNGQPLAVSVRNDDRVAHTVTVNGGQHLRRPDPGLHRLRQRGPGDSPAGRDAHPHPARVHAADSADPIGDFRKTPRKGGFQRFFGNMLRNLIRLYFKPRAARFGVLLPHNS